MRDDFIIALSNSDSPIPGGGAAAAYTSCVGIALLKKIIGIEMTRRQGIFKGFPWTDLMNQVLILDEKLFRLRDEDGKSYMRLAEAKAQGKSKIEIASALGQAIECPLRIMEQAGHVLISVSQTAKYCKRHLLPDLQVVCELQNSAVRSAYHITQSNLALMTDHILMDDYQKKLNELYDRCCETLKVAESSILHRYN